MYNMCHTMRCHVQCRDARPRTLRVELFVGMILVHYTVFGEWRKIVASVMLLLYHNIETKKIKNKINSG
jgi:hypothetical protein